MGLAFCVLMGLAIGSFLNVCISRIPLDESIVHPRSRCPQCRKPIAGYDNIPVLSYVLLRGRCRNCGKGISVRYPLTEALTAVISALVYLKFGLGVEWAVYFAFSAALIVLAFIDADHRILPDPITKGGIAAGLVVSLFLFIDSSLVARLISAAGASPTQRLVSFASSLIGALVGGGILWGVGEAYFRVRGVEGMGFGDVKMMAMVGAFLGAPLAVMTIMLGSLVGSVVGLSLMRFGGTDRNYELPFGTFLSFGAIASLLVGNELLRWYLNFMAPGTLGS
jgi:leader peptidase (prepilin peptidase)/N-methyltransferase